MSSSACKASTWAASPSRRSSGARAARCDLNVQVQLVKPSETDVVISILWSRLGTRLPAQFTRADGSRYESGTEYEFEEAMEGFRRNGKPDLLVYRRTAPPSVRLDDERDLMERLAQKKKLDEFSRSGFTIAPRARW